MSKRLNQTQKDSVLGVCQRSTEAFSLAFYPNRFHRPFSSQIHQPIFSKLDNAKSQKVAIAAPRGTGKTSIFTLAYPSRRICFQDAHNILIISDNQSHAIRQTETLKRHLTTNPQITKVFGDLKPSGDTTFSKEQWITSSNISVQPLGAGQQLRGQLHEDFRPDLVIVDDLEDKEGVRNQERRDILKEFVLEDILGMFDLADKNWKLCVIGTILHEDSLLNTLITDPAYSDWDSVRLELCDDDYVSNWPEYMSGSDCRDLAESFRKKGKLDSFYREYRNLPIATEDAMFTTDMFQYYEEADLNQNHIESFVMIDPAKTTGKRSAYTAIIGLSMDYMSSKVYVRKLVMERLKPDEIVDAAFETAQTIGARTIGIEVTGLNEFAIHPFRDAMSRYRTFYELVELKARGHKRDRVAALGWYYRNKLVWHNNDECGPLEEQLLLYPRSKYWDLMDALAYLIEMKEHGSRYFMPDEGFEDEAEIEKEYAELEAGESKGNSDWRLS